MNVMLTLYVVIARQTTPCVLESALTIAWNKTFSTVKTAPLYVYEVHGESSPTEKGGGENLRSMQLRWAPASRHNQRQ